MHQSNEQCHSEEQRNCRERLQRALGTGMDAGPHLGTRSVFSKANLFSMRWSLISVESKGSVAFINTERHPRRNFSVTLAAPKYFDGAEYKRICIYPQCSQAAVGFSPYFKLSVPSSCAPKNTVKVGRLRPTLEAVKRSPCQQLTGREE